jgi:single-stranded-DNA-specific exonuclease RecJ
MVSSVPAVKKKIWKFPQEAEPSSELLQVVGGSEILARLLIRRGIDSAEKAGSFLDPQKYVETSPMVFAQMEKAIARISQAIAQKEKITVYGDYDVDGVTATSVMFTVLKQLGANVDFYIPNRANEGYGLNLKAVSVLASKQRTKLIITCDCGISNFAEINLAKSLGVETIIVDHHSMPELLPPAVAILHPKQFAEDHPLFHLPGVGVAFKLAEALLIHNKQESEIAKLLDFVTLGMIADMVPLVQENRYLVQIGLPVLVNSPRAGIKALLDNTVKMDGTDIVGFGLAPRINAVGRLSDASLAVKLMTVEDEAEAQELAHQLELENERRQELCEQIFLEADLKARQALASGQDAAIAIYSANWHHGVVGIVASRLVEKYHCPVFIAELDAEEGKIKGSARGVPGIDLYQILKANEHLMTKWGGHQMAAGFSAEQANADVLCRALVETCARALAGKQRRPVLEIDLSIDAAEMDLSLTKLLRKLGPFGMWNKKPVLAMSSLTVLNSRPLGKEGKHHRLMLRSSDASYQFECVYWRSSGNIPTDGEEIDLAFTPEVNVFNNTERLQLVLSDWRKPGEQVEEEENPEELLDFNPPLDEANTKGKLGEPGEKQAITAQAQAPSTVHLQTRFDGVTARTNISRQNSAEDTYDDMEELAEPITAGSRSNSGDESSSTNSKAIVQRAQQMNWKDLRFHQDPNSVVDAAVRKLGAQLNIFAEACKLNSHILQDRSSVLEIPHLLIWQYPPSIQVFRSLLSKSNASNIYLCGAAPAENQDTASFLKRLFAMLRYAVNQRDGQAHAEKLCAGLATTKMALALGLALLKKVDAIDWYAEDSMIFVEITGSPGEGMENHSEYRQLANTLKEIMEFRSWCAEAPLDEIQSELLPNSIRLYGQKGEASQETQQEETTYPRVNNNDRASRTSGKH